MMKKIVLMVLLLVLTACGGQKQNAASPFLEGTTGVRVNFIQDAPPAEVYDRGQFPFEVALQLENVGETDVAKDKIQVTLKGVDPAEFGKTSSSFVLRPNEDLKGAKKDASGVRVDGTLAEVSVADLNYAGTITGASVERLLVANICYEYASKAVADLCVLSNVLKDNSAVCKINEAKQVFSTGAPIRVTSFTERSSGTDKVEFDFTIENQGAVKGIYKENSGCAEVRSNENIVRVAVSGINGIQCTGLSEGGYVTLLNNKKTIKCILSTAGATDYEKTINIDLAYAISDDISTTLRIAHTG